MKEKISPIPGEETSVPESGVLMSGKGEKKSEGEGLGMRKGEKKQSESVPLRGAPTTNASWGKGGEQLLTGGGEIGW